MFPRDGRREERVGGHDERQLTPTRGWVGDDRRLRRRRRRRRAVVGTLRDARVRVSVLVGGVTWATNGSRVATRRGGLSWARPRSRDLGFRPAAGRHPENPADALGPRTQQPLDFIAQQGGAEDTDADDSGRDPNERPIRRARRRSSRSRSMRSNRSIVSPLGVMGTAPIAVSFSTWLAGDVSGAGLGRERVAQPDAAVAAEVGFFTIDRAAGNTFHSVPHRSQKRAVGRLRWPHDDNGPRHPPAFLIHSLTLPKREQCGGDPAACVDDKKCQRSGKSDAKNPYKSNYLDLQMSDLRNHNLTSSR